MKKIKDCSFMKKSKFYEKFAKRTEDGGSTLLVIMVVGMLVLAIFGTVASTAALSSQINKEQVGSLKATTAQTNILNSFEGYFYAQSSTGANVSTGSRTVTNVGTFRTYYSTSPVKPTSTTSAGVTVESTSVPLTATWLVVKVTPTNGTPKDFVYKLFPTSSKANKTPVYLDTMRISMKNNSLITSAPGVPFLPETVVNSNNTTLINSITASKIDGSLSLSNTNTAITTFTNNTVNGDLKIKNHGNLSNSIINGDYCAIAAGSTNTNGVKGNIRVSATGCIPTAAATLKRETLNPTNLVADVTLTGTQCTNFSTFKALLEQDTGATERIISAQSCSNTSMLDTVNEKVINLKSPVTLYLKSGASKNLTIKSANPDLPVTFNYVVTAGSTINNLKHEGGVSGGVYFYADTGSLILLDSKITGSVHGISKTAAASSLVDLNNTKVYYSPTTSKILGVTGLSTTTTRPTILRVS